MKVKLFGVARIFGGGTDCGCDYDRMLDIRLKDECGCQSRKVAQQDLTEPGVPTSRPGSISVMSQRILEFHLGMGYRIDSGNRGEGNRNGEFLANSGIISSCTMLLYQDK